MTRAHGNKGRLLSVAHRAALKVPRPHSAEHCVALRKHGHARPLQSPTYRSWGNMIQRCYNPKNVNYPRYGGRLPYPVTVCDAWRESFKAFLAYIGERPEGMTLDRIDPMGNYEPDNCRWATPKEQRANQRAA